MFDRFWVRAIALRPRDGNVDSSLSTANQEAVANIVSIAHVGYIQAFQPLLVLDQRREVCKYLAWMVFVRKAVDDRSIGVLGENDKIVMGIDPAHYGFDVSVQDFGSVRNGFSPSELHLVPTEINWVAT